MNRARSDHQDDQQFDVVYECPDCEQRLLNQRRCPDCQLFCRRIGRGGACPHCDEAVAITDLAQLTSPEVTQPGPLTRHRWWLSLGRSHGHQRAGLMTVPGQFLLALDIVVLATARA